MSLQWFSTSRARYAAAIVAVAALWLTLTLLRLAALPWLEAGNSLSASYHVLWTVKALSASSAEAHGWLPTVTLTPDPVLSPDWGALLSSEAGARIYTSFPPLGFLLPTLFLGEDPDMAGLATLNAVFGGISALLAGLLGASVRRCAARSRTAEDHWAGPTVFAVVAALYLLAPEMLQSHGVVYWPQSPAQIPLLLGLALLFRRLRNVAARWELAPLLLCCFVYPSLEWTGFVFCGGVALALAVHSTSGEPEADRRAARMLRTAQAVFRGPPLAVLAAGTLALFVIVTHFAIVLGVDPFLESLTQRAGSRAQTKFFTYLPFGYFVSFGLLPLVFLWACWKARASLRRDALGLLFLAALFPMIENLLLSMHAWLYTFDRMKLAAPMIVAICAWVGSATPPMRARTVALVFALLALSNVAMYSARIYDNRQWPRMMAKNQDLAQQALLDPLADCAIWGQDGWVRGSINLPFNRDIFENQTPEGLVDLARGRGEDVCAAAFIETRHPYLDLRSVISITFFDREGAVIRAYHRNPEG